MAYARLWLVEKYLCSQRATPGLEPRDCMSIPSPGDSTLFFRLLARVQTHDFRRTSARRIDLPAHFFIFSFSSKLIRLIIIGHNPR